MATNLLRPGPLSVRGHLVALTQIERGYRAFGLSGASDPAALPGRRTAPGRPASRRSNVTSVHYTVHAPPAPGLPSGACYLRCLLTPRGRARPGPGRVRSRPRLDLAWTATPEAASDVSYLIDARIRSARRARDRVIGYDLCVASVRTRLYRLYVCNGRPQRTATGTAIFGPWGRTASA